MPLTAGISLSPPMPMQRRTCDRIHGDAMFGKGLDPRGRMGVVAVDERAVDVEQNSFE